jgi:hypothetical protein
MHLTCTQIFSITVMNIVIVVNLKIFLFTLLRNMFGLLLVNSGDMKNRTRKIDFHLTTTITTQKRQIKQG